MREIASGSGDVNGDGSSYTVCVGILPNSYEVITGDTNGLDCEWQCAYD